MYVLTICIKRNQSGSDSPSSYLRKAVKCEKDFPCVFRSDGALDGEK